VGTLEIGAEGRGLRLGHSEPVHDDHVSRLR
jgi:hypothetical protein